MFDHRVFAGTAPLRVTLGAGATAIFAMGLALAGAGTASADVGRPHRPFGGSTANAAGHTVADTTTNVRPTVGGGLDEDVRSLVGGLNKDLRGLVRGLNKDVRSLVGGLNKDVRSLAGGVTGTPPGGGPGTGTSHPINSRSLQQIQALQTKAANLSEIIESSGIDNSNATAALEELTQERDILVKAGTLANGIQNGTTPNTQEKQVLIYLSQAQALQAEAHARLRNNIN